MREDERFLIGELAEQAGVNRETLRYYERRGLLNPAPYRVRLSGLRPGIGRAVALHQAGAGLRVLARRDP